MQWKSTSRLVKFPALRRCFASGRVPTFPDPPCIEIDKKCHFVKSNTCEQARHKLTRVLPADRYLDQMQREGPGKCCVYRPTHRLPCPDKYRPREKEKPPKPPFRSMWQPPCHPHEQPHCTDLLPRFDDIYYKPSEKCRCYQRTWIECPNIRLRMKKVCCLDGIEPPEVLYRYKARCPKVACELDYERMRRICQHIRDPECRCEKTHWPCCKAARCPPRCVQTKHPSNCRKLRAPHPSFSEIKKRWERPKRLKECHCRQHISQCEAIAYKRRRELMGLKI
ncbi:uncharacterized protein LOC6640780 [Drosophila willistoni]|nr:uncharacterized protein LOC6640780 [Drosophila willistoni]